MFVKADEKMNRATAETKDEGPNRMPALEEMQKYLPSDAMPHYSDMPSLMDLEVLVRRVANALLSAEL